MKNPKHLRPPIVNVIFVVNMMLEQKPLTAPLVLSSGPHFTLKIY